MTRFFLAKPSFPIIFATPAADTVLNQTPLFYHLFPKMVPSIASVTSSDEELLQAIDNLYQECLFTAAPSPSMCRIYSISVILPFFYIYAGKPRSCDMGKLRSFLNECFAECTNVCRSFKTRY